MTTVGCVGGLTLDWVKQAGGITGPTVGGNALYSAVGARLAGARPVVCAVVGHDFPEELPAQLESHGIDVDAVRRVEGPSFHVLLDDSGPERRVSYLPTSGRNTELDPIASQLVAWDIAHVAAIPTSSQQALARGLAALGVPYTLDTIVIPGEIEPDRADLEALARRSSGFLPSLQEVEVLWPHEDLRVRLTALGRALGTAVVATCAADGAVGSDGERLITVPAYPTRVVDTTGAGDAYCGAFAATVAAGADLGRAMAVASAASSLVIEAYGGMHALHEGARDEVLRRAEQLVGLTREEESNVVEL